MILSCFFIVSAAICNAIMDRVENLTSFQRSIFSTLNPKWWCKEVSWEYVGFLPYTKYRPDAWHLSKSLMIIFLCSSVISYTPAVNGFISLLLFGLLWNLTFNLFYNKLLKIN